MKTIVMTTLAVLLTATSVYAQPDGGMERGGKHGGKHRGDPVAHLTEKLNLSDEQVTEVQAIFEESRAQHMAIQSSVRDEHCAVREQTHAQLKAVLTEEQMTQFDAMEGKRMGRGRQHGMPKFADCDL